MIKPPALKKIVQIFFAISICSLLLSRLGLTPFLNGLELVNFQAIQWGLALGALTTLASAWRWRAVSQSLSVYLSFKEAIAWCYRSLFLNITLPFGVAGDVHRAVVHSRWSGDSRGARSVIWERGVGQVVQLTCTAIILLFLPNPFRTTIVRVGAVIVGLCILILLGAFSLRLSVPLAWRRILKTVKDDLRLGLMARQTWPVLITSSLLIVVGNVATFCVAARIVGVKVSLLTLVTMALVLLAAMSVPISVGGLGVREGAAAAIFVAAGLSASAGVSTAVLYAVMAFLGSLPGLILLIVLLIGRTNSKERVYG